MPEEARSLALIDWYVSNLHRSDKPPALSVAYQRVFNELVIFLKGHGSEPTGA